MEDYQSVSGAALLQAHCMVMTGYRSQQSPGTKRSLRIPKQRAETLLLEMPIVGQYVREAFAEHCLHGNTIGETIPLIGPAAVKLKTSEKRVPSLWKNADMRRAQDILHRRRSFDSQLRIGRTEGPKLWQYLVRGHDQAGAKGAAEIHNPVMGAVSGISESDPVEGIGKDCLH
jgi:hypothetical protein